MSETILQKRSSYSPLELLRFIYLVYVRKKSPDKYYEFQLFQGEMLTRYLETKGIRLNSSRVLDIACGQGGYSVALKDKGAYVVSLDLNIKVLSKALCLVQGNALDNPFTSDTFDLIICSSLIEHVPNPNGLLEELMRIVKPNGLIYISFPPFYSLNGGHQFSPFHYFGENLAIKLSKRAEYNARKRWKSVFYEVPLSYRTAYGNWGLYKFTIKKFRDIINEYPVNVIDQSTRWLPIDISKIPIIGEILTWHVQFLLQKKNCYK